MSEITSELSALSLDGAPKVEKCLPPKPHLSEIVSIDIIENIISHLTDTAKPCYQCEGKCTRSQYHRSGLRHLFSLSTTCRKISLPVQKLLLQHLRIRSYCTEQDGETFTYESEDCVTDFAIPEVHILRMIDPLSTLMVHAKIHVV